MDLKNTIREDNLVVLKQGVQPFRVGVCETEFVPNTYYRCIKLENDGHREYVIFGERFVNEQYDEAFETVQDLFLREFEQLGIIVNGKVISKSAFSKLIDVHQLGRTSKSGFKVGYIYTHPKELMYVFMPFFTGDTKAECINSAYRSVRDIIEGDMQCVEDDYIQRTNTGIPTSMRASHVFEFVDKSKYKTFSLD